MPQGFLKSLASERKQELRKIVIDIVFGREKVNYDPSQFSHLAIGVAEVLQRRVSAGGGAAAVFPHQTLLQHEDQLLVQEIFWDLVVEKIITIGKNPSN